MTNESVQFLGKAGAYGITWGSTSSPLDGSSYHSLIGEDTLFGSPQTFTGAVGVEQGVVASYFVGGEGVLLAGVKGVKYVGPTYQKLKKLTSRKDPDGKTSTAHENVNLANGEMDFYDRVDNAGDLTSKEINNSVINKPRIGSANKPPDGQHGFNDIIDNYAGNAAKFKLSTKGPGGKVVRTSELRQIEGSNNGIDGVFEWIVDQDNVTHRRFIPQGTVTGEPNQIPKK